MKILKKIFDSIFCSKKIYIIVRYRFYSQDINYILIDIMDKDDIWIGRYYEKSKEFIRSNRDYNIINMGIEYLNSVGLEVKEN